MFVVWAGDPTLLGSASARAVMPHAKTCHEGPTCELKEAVRLVTD